MSSSNPNPLGSSTAICSDSTELDYISGGAFSIGLSTPPSGTSPSPFVLGNNNLIIFDSNISSSIGIDAFESTSGISNGLHSTSGYSLTPMDTTSLISSVGFTFPINITQLSTPSSIGSNGCWNFGDALIGSGQATIYVLDTIDNSSQQPYRYRRPYNIEINFKGYQFQ